MRLYWRTFTITLIVVVALFLIGQLPDISILGHQMRPVDLLADVRTTTATIAEAEANSSTTTPADSSQDTTAMIPLANDRGLSVIDFATDSITISAFVRKLHALSSNPKGNVRIAYYGDSFIEGDILTADLRDLLQEQYGGGGVGLLDVSSVVEASRGTISQHSTAFRTLPINHPNYEAQHGSTNLHYSIPTAATASVLFEAKGFNKTFRRHNADIHRSTIYYSTDVPITLTATVNDSATQTFTPQPSPDIQTATVEGDISKVLWTAKTDASGRSWFYSVALDKGTGVQVDNISIRGVDGSCIRDINDHHMAQMAHLRPYDLIIFGFGLNFASDQYAKDGYSQYRAKAKGVIEKLRRHYPQTPILIVSVSDRCQKGAGGQISTMPCIPTLVEAQYEIARDNHVAFWNLYQAMGGANSMQRLVEDMADGKRKANKDYTHITYDGGQILARLLLKALDK